MHEVHTYQFAYIPCCRDGIILLDEENTYFYTKGTGEYDKVGYVTEEIK